MRQPRCSARLPQDEVHGVRQRIGEHDGGVNGQRRLQRLLRAHVLPRPQDLHVLEGLELRVDLRAACARSKLRMLWMLMRISAGEKQIDAIGKRCCRRAL